MRILKIMLIAVALCVVSALSIGCGSGSDSTLSESQIVTVHRGDLVIDITAVGNLALSSTKDLAFEIAGTVEEILVEEGESVEEGQVLAKLDTSEWERQLTTLERQLPAKQLNLLQEEINLKNAKRALDKAREYTYTWPDIETAQADVDEAEDYLEYALWNAAEKPAEKEFWERIVSRAEERLDEAETRLKEIEAGTHIDELALKELQFEMAELRLEDAQKAVEDAKKALAEAMNTSPEITAPFAGFITKVNVSGGDEVKKGTVAVTIADPTKFEADILVNEMDFLHIKLGGEARVQVDAMPGLSLSAKVAHISPTAVIQSGVVNYKVKVEVQSLEEAMQERQQTEEGIPSGELSEQMKQAIEEGRLTQEQVEEMMKQRQQAPAGKPEGQQRQMPTMVPEDFKLAEGMTITLSIITQERKDVLLVPIQAIISRGRETLVQVLKDGIIEERSITVGISNWQYTEVTDGLSEGEQVVVPETSPEAPTTPQQQRQPGGMMPIPGMPRILQ